MGVIGGTGLLLFLAGSLAPGAAPGIDDPTAEWAAYLTENRRTILIGAVLVLTAVPLLLVVLAGIATRGERAIDAAGVLSLATWVFAFGFLVLSVLLTAAVAWRGPSRLDASTVRFALDAAHLSLWGLSAGPAAVAVIATTATARRQGLAPYWLLALAVIKVLTCLVELAGVGLTEGWNAGGYASFSSGIALVAWLAGVVFVTARDKRTTL